MQAGAFDFITKPWNNLMLLKSVRNAFDLTEKTDEEPVLNRSRFGKIVGKSPQLTAILQTVSRIAPTTASVLITGESGTGKELIAEAIHENSQRAEEPFVKVNLGGLTQSLFESELFGHKKGAFTDAYADRTGRFEMANHGTIFLDEIGDLELSSQVKLLRVLQDQTFEPLGESRPHKVDVRVVSATNRDLPTMVAERTFREDLYYRINLITIHLPALRERREDIPLLVRHFADRLAETNALPHVDFSPEALAYLQQLPFPGNIRELKNLVERTLLVSGKTYVEASDFIQFGNPTPAANQSSSTSSTSPLNGLTLEELERQGILQALERYGNNLTQAALALGISRAALYRRMEKHHIKL
jgi:two-component system NtrC family response regulator